MKILILGDVMGLSGRNAIKKNLSQIIKENKINFSIINGENAATDGKGITKEIAEEFFIGDRLLHLETIFGIKKKPQVILKMKIDF